MEVLRVEVEDLAGDLALALPFAGAVAAAAFLAGIVMWITLRSRFLVRSRELGLGEYVEWGGLLRGIGIGKFPNLGIVYIGG